MKTQQKKLSVPEHPVYEQSSTVFQGIFQRSLDGNRDTNIHFVCVGKYKRPVCVVLEVYKRVSGRFFSFFFVALLP